MDIGKDILTFIRRKEETGALLITGKWGSGKTYYLKNLARELNAERREYLGVISLFGIDSIANLNKAVKECYLEANSTFFNKTARKIGRIVSKTIDNGLKVAEAATGGNVAVSGVQKGLSSVLSLGLLDFISVKRFIGRGKSQRPFVLVFDDLERCKINMIDLLGAINEYSENRNIKTLILVSEEKLLAREKSDNNEHSTTEQREAKDDYADFKEKVIFETLRFKADYSTIIDSMIESYQGTEKGYVEFLQDNASVIKQVFWESKQYNLRSIKKIITKFERIFGVLRKVNMSDKISSKILYSFSAKSFEAKPRLQDDDESQGYMATIDRLMQTDFSSLGKYYGEGINVLSLDQWIEFEQFDEEAIISELKQMSNPVQITDKIKALRWPIFDLDWSTTTKGLRDALNDAYEGTLDGRDYVGLIDRLQAYERYGITIDFVDYKKLSEGIDKFEARCRTYGENEENGVFVSNDIMKCANMKTKPLLEKLKYVEHNLSLWEARLKFLRAIRSKERRFYALDLHWLEVFDDELLEVFTKEYNEADNAQKREMSQYMLGLDFIYGNDHGEEVNGTERKIKMASLKTSILNFKKLQADVKERDEKETDHITKTILYKFSDDLLEKIQQLTTALTAIENNCGKSN